MIEENKYVRTYMETSKKAFERALIVTPYKTGNLRYRAMKYRYNKGGSATIRIDLGIAPYAKYIDKPGYKTHGWWDRYLDQYVKEIQSLTNAKRRK